MACDPNTLIADSVCLQSCIPTGMMPAVQISLLCQILSASSLYVLKTGDTMTGPLLINSGTLIASAPAISISQTWNNAGVAFTGLKLNVTNTASLVSSLLLDLQVSAVSQFRVTRLGEVTAVNYVSTGAVGFGTPVVAAVQMTLLDALASTILFVNNASNTGGVAGTGGNAIIILRSTTTASYGWRLIASGSLDQLEIQDEGVSTMAVFAGTGNLILGSNSSTQPASLTRGLVFIDGAAASANPGSGAVIGSTSGALLYRTSGANEGAGATNNLHNRAAQVTGAGSNYTLTAATARVDFGTTDAEVVLPTAGTYLVQASVNFIGDAVGSGDGMRVKLRNSTDSTDVGAERPASMALALGRLNVVLDEVVTITASKTIQIFGHNATAARGSVDSTATTIKYVRLY